MYWHRKELALSNKWFSIQSLTVPWWFTLVSCWRGWMGTCKYSCLQLWGPPSMCTIHGSQSRFLATPLITEINYKLLNTNSVWNLLLSTENVIMLGESESSGKAIPGRACPGLLMEVETPITSLMHSGLNSSGKVLQIPPGNMMFYFQNLFFPQNHCFVSNYRTRMF